MAACTGVEKTVHCSGVSTHGRRATGASWKVTEIKLLLTNKEIHKAIEKRKIGDSDIVIIW